jgi:hypothetical protein
LRVSVWWRVVGVVLGVLRWVPRDVALVVYYYRGGYTDSTVLDLLLGAFLNINSFILKDRNADKSLDLWAPVNWYNASMAD